MLQNRIMQREIAGRGLNVRVERIPLNWFGVRSFRSGIEILDVQVASKRDVGKSAGSSSVESGSPMNTERRTCRKHFGHDRLPLPQIGGCKRDSKSGRRG